MVAKVSPTVSDDTKGVVPGGRLTKALTADQVDITLNSHAKKLATYATLLAAFIDIACSVILQPAHPMMSSNAPKAVKPSAWPDGYKHPQAFPSDGGMPEYQWAVTCMLVANQIGQSIASFLFGSLSDRLGRRACMLLCTFMGAVTMAGYYIAGVVVKSYWLYVAFQFLNGLFGAMKTLAQAYIQDINEPEDFKSLQPLIIMMFTFGGVAGGLLGGTVNGAIRVDDKSGDLFTAALIGLGLELASFLAIFINCIDPPRKGATKPPGAAAGPAPANPGMDSKVRQILLVIIIGGGLDAFGDNGNTFARNVIFSNRYPLGKEPAWNTILISIKAAGVFLAMILVVRSAKCIRMPLWTIIGNLFSSFCQFGIIPNAMPMGAFVAVWTCSQCFGFTSTMAEVFLLPGFAPAASRGFWLGLQGAVNMLCMASAPLVLSGIYSLLIPAPGSPASEFATAELATLATCGSISLIAAVLFIRLICLLPKPPSPTAGPAITKDDLPTYRQMSEREITRLSGQERYQVNKLLLEDKQDPLYARWISYQEDFEAGDLSRIMSSAQGDFKFIENILMQKLKAPTEMAQDCANDSAMRSAFYRGYDVDVERQQMGTWLSNYLNDAGYHSWLWYPDIYKAMFMNAFPPVNKLDGKPVEFESVEDYESYIIKFNGVVKRHIAMTQRPETTEAMKSLNTLGPKGN